MDTGQLLAFMISAGVLGVTAIGTLIKVLREIRKDRDAGKTVMDSLNKIEQEVIALGSYVDGERWIQSTEASLYGKLQGALSFMPNDEGFRFYVNLVIRLQIGFTMTILRSVVADLNMDYVALSYRDIEKQSVVKGSELISEGLNSYLGITVQSMKYRYLTGIEEIIKDTQNAKRYRIRDLAEEFVSDYLCELSKSWHNYSGKKE